MLKNLTYVVIILLFTNVYATNVQYISVNNLFVAKNNSPNIAALVSDPVVNFETAIDSITEYLKIKNSDHAKLESFCKNKARCTTMLWAYMNLLKNKPDQEGYNNLLGKLNKILVWDKKASSLSLDLAAIFAELLANINHIDGVLYPNHKKLDLDKLLKTKSNIRLHREYSVVSPLTLQQLAQLLKADIVHKNRIVYIVSSFHTTAIYKNNDEYCYFDAYHLDRGEKISKDAYKIAKAIFEAHDFFHTPVLALGFIMVTNELIEDGAANVYSKLDGYLDAMQVKSHDILYRGDAIELCKQISCVNSCKFLESRKHVKSDAPVVIEKSAHTQEADESTIDDETLPNIPVTSINKLIYAQETDKGARDCKNLENIILQDGSEASVNIPPGYINKPVRAQKADEEAENCEILKKVVLQGDDATLKTLIATGKADLKQRINGKTLLLIAVEKGYCDIASVLINDGKVSVDESIIDGKTALMYAAQLGNVAMVKLLLQAKANRNLADMEGNTPLMFATAQGHAQVVSVLLFETNARVDIDTRATSRLFDVIASGDIALLSKIIKINPYCTNKIRAGFDALMYAADCRQLNILKLLLSRCQVAKDSLSPMANFLVAASRGDIKKVQDFILNDKFLYKYKFYDTALVLAIYNQHTNLVQILSNSIKKDAAVCGRTYLMYAANTKNTQLIKILLDRVQINKEKQDIWIDIMIAIAAKNNKILPKLLQKVDVCKQNKYAYLALQIAIISNNNSVIQYLMDLKQINDPDDSGNTLLSYAASNNNYEAVMLLLKHGALINHRNNLGTTPIMLAAKHGFLDIVLLLLDYKANANEVNNSGSNALMLATKNGYYKTAVILLNKTDDMNQKDNNNDSVLIFAAIGDHFELINALIEKGADVDHQDKNGTNALICAVVCENFKIVNLLLSKNAKIDQQDKYGCTALMRAVQSNYEDMVRLLLSKNANIYIKNNDTKDVMALAAGRNMGIDDPMYKLLVEWKKDNEK